MYRRATTVALIALVSIAAPRVRAQELSPADKAAAKEHFDKGRAAYDAGQYEESIKELKQAYMISRKAAILFNLGQTYVKLGDSNLALHFFQKFMAESDPADPNRPIAQTALDEIQAKNKPPAPTAPPAPAPDRPEGGPAPAEGDAGAKVAAPDFRHLPVGDAPPRHPIDIRIRVGEEALAYPSTLFYRTLGQENYTKVPFAKAGSALSARIPKKAIAAETKAVQYYVETRSPDGKIYGSSGSAANPNVIAIDPNATPKVVSETETAGTTPGSEPARGMGENADEGAESKLPLARYYRPAKYAAAGLAVVMLTVATVYAAQGSRLEADMEKKSRSSSGQTMSGTWTNPTMPFGPAHRSVEEDGKTANTMVGVGLVLGVVFGATAGGLFYLDHLREQGGDAEDDVDVAFAPVVGPGFGGASGIIRF